MSKKSISTPAVTSSEFSGSIAQRIAARWNSLRHGFRKLALFVELFVSNGSDVARR